MGVLLAFFLSVSLGALKADETGSQSNKVENDKSGNPSVSWDWVNEG